MTTSRSSKIYTTEWIPPSSANVEPSRRRLLRPPVYWAAGAVVVLLSLGALYRTSPLVFWCGLVLLVLTASMIFGGGFAEDGSLLGYLVLVGVVIGGFTMCNQRLDEMEREDREEAAAVREEENAPNSYPETIGGDRACVRRLSAIVNESYLRDHGLVVKAGQGNVATVQGGGAIAEICVAMPPDTSVDMATQMVVDLIEERYSD